MRPYLRHRLVVTVLLACASTAIAEDSLGRLFFTPERRQQLDHQRELNVQDEEPVSAAPAFTINGLVTRSSGKQTVWLDDKPFHDHDTDEVIVRKDRHRPGQVTLSLPGDRRSEAPVGATVNRATGESSDVLGDGIVRRKPARQGQ